MTLQALSKSFKTSVLVASLLIATLTPATGQTEQKVEVTIKDSKFVSTGTTLMPEVPVVVTIVNKDNIRHDFSSVVLQGHPTQVEGNGVIAHGQGIEGAYIEGGRDAIIRFTTERPGRFEFRCTIHPTMRGELLLMNVGAV
ncbi:MAG TPA: cupredoxin domain-containing protein [Nitrospira sp.]